MPFMCFDNDTWDAPRPTSSESTSFAGAAELHEPDWRPQSPVGTSNIPDSGTVRHGIEVWGLFSVGGIISVGGWTPLRDPKIYKNKRNSVKTYPNPIESRLQRGSGAAPPVSGLGRFLWNFFMFLYILGALRGGQTPTEIMHVRYRVPKNWSGP